MPVVVNATEDIEDPFVVDELLAALFVDLIELDADEGGEGGYLFEGTVLVLVRVPFLLGSTGAVATREMAGIEHESEVGMVDRRMKTEHVVAGGGEAAMVLQGDDHAEVGTDFGTASEGVDTAFEGVFRVASGGGGADEDADEGSAQKEAGFHADAALFDLGVDTFRELAELGRDGEAGHR